MGHRWVNEHSTEWADSRASPSVSRQGASVDTGLDTIRLSVAVAWIEAGARIGAVTYLLRYSSAAITGDICRHRSDEAARGRQEAKHPRSVSSGIGADLDEH